MYNESWFPLVRKHIKFLCPRNNIFSIIVLDNNSGIKPADIERFDYKALADDFENPILIRALDIKAFPLFGFVFAKTDEKNNSVIARFWS